MRVYGDWRGGGRWWEAVRDFGVCPSRWVGVAGGGGAGEEGRGRGAGLMGCEWPEGAQQRWAWVRRITRCTIAFVLAVVLFWLGFCSLKVTEQSRRSQRSVRQGLQATASGGCRSSAVCRQGRPQGGNAVLAVVVSFGLLLVHS